MNPSRILVVGSGGREHALAWRLARDAHAPTVWVAPGNDGMASSFTRLAIAEDDAPALLAAVRTHAIELVVIGPEAPLAAGVSDALSAAAVRVFGASQAAARLESSKWFAKEIMLAANVPTARAAVHDEVGSALAALGDFGPHWVVKADGLTSGKGAIVCETRDEAVAAAASMLKDKRFGKAGERVVIEEYVPGEEVSFLVLCDGTRAIPLASVQDHKRLLDGDLCLLRAPVLQQQVLPKLGLPGIEAVTALRDAPLPHR